MELLIGVSKVNKYATRESGDTLEVIERPGGGISVVLADGQRSGKSAKRISNKVVRKVISLLAEGVRDGAAARAASDYLFHERGGKVSATLNILSVDLISNTLVITRNSDAPVFVVTGTEVAVMDEPSLPVGVRRHTRPVIHECPLETGLTVLLFTDGISHAGKRYGTPMNPEATLRELLARPGLNTQEMADGFLQRAIELERGRPSDDISVVVLQVVEHNGDNVRRLQLRIPIEP